MKIIRLMAFGGCMLRGPLYRARSPKYNQTTGDWNSVPNDVVVVGPPFSTYTFGEIFQTLDVYRGNRYIPVEIRPLCGIGPNFMPNPVLALRQLDGILVEPNTSNEILFEGYYLNRAPLLRVLTPFKKQDRVIRKLADRWYNHGIVGMDAEVRRATAAKLIAALPADIENRELAVAVLRNAQGVRRDIKAGFRQLLEMVDVPIGVVSYTWQYMPDGRPISWPADFYKAVKATAAEFNLPLYEPRTLIEQAGTEATLKPDLRHYREDFMPTIAKSLADFAHRVASRASDQAAAAAANRPVTAAA